MIDAAQRARAERLLALHDPSRPLLLANAWDVASARVFEELGSDAVATSSGGVAAVLGYADGEQIPRAEMIDMVGRIARAVAVPVTADVERGYGDAGATARAVLEAGAVGINLEDGTGDPANLLSPLALHAARIAEARAAADALGVHLVINARTDVFLAQVGAPPERFEAAVARGRAYAAAGADCIFVPGVADGDTIGRLVRAIGRPLNVLAGPHTPRLSELATLGVARVSLGSGPMRAALTQARAVATALRGGGDFSALDGLISHTEVNRLFARPRPQPR